MKVTKDNSALLFTARANNIFKFVSYETNDSYKVDLTINNEEYMTKKQRKRFHRYLNKCTNISRSAYVKFVKELMDEIKSKRATDDL